MNKISLNQTLLLVILFILNIAFAQSQENYTANEKSLVPIKIGVKAGYSLGKLTSSDNNVYTKNYESVRGIDFGFTIEFQLNDVISIQPEINYTQRGGKRIGMQPVVATELSNQLNQFLPFIGMPLITADNPLYADYESESDLNYLEFPVLLKFGWGNDFRFYGEVGPYLGILLSAKQITRGLSQFYFDEAGTNPVVVPNPSGNPPFVPLPSQSLVADTKIKENLSTVNFGGIVGLGVIKKINEKSEIFFDARASYSFNAIQLKDTYGESNIGGVIFSIGYAYSLL